MRLGRPVLIWATCCFAVVLACGKKDDKGASQEPSGSSGTYGFGKVVVKSSTLGLTSVSDSNPTNCGFSMDVYRGEGVCLTPLSLSGQATKVDLHADVAGRASTRIFSESESSQQPGEILPGEFFDLADPAKSKLVGNNTLFEEFDTKPTYKGLSVTFNYVTFKVGLNSKFVTVLIPSYDQPFADYAKSACSLTDDEATQERYKNADLLSGMSFKRGDFLFCVKDTATATCAVSDYQWLDAGTKTLVSTRPSSPKASTHLGGKKVTCDGGAERRFGFNFDNIALYASLDTTAQFKLYSDYSHGTSSKSSPVSGATVSPYFIYYYTSPTGAVSEGANLSLTLDIDPTQAVFIEGYRQTDLASVDLGALLSKLHLKSQWAFDQKYNNSVQGGYSSHFAGMTATVKVELTGGKEPPISQDKL